MNYSGLVVAGAQLGAQAVLFRPKRSIGDFTGYVAIEETHEDVMEITDHPVELGAKVSDHAYKEPSSVVIRAGWSNSPTAGNYLDSLKQAVTGTVSGVTSLINNNGESQVKAIYEKFLKLQADRTLVDVYTGKRSYKNMLVKSIHEQTNVDTENNLILTITLRQLIVVSTKILDTSAANISTDPSKMATPQKNAISTNSGAKQLIPASSVTFLF